MTMCRENLGGGCIPTLSCSTGIKEPRAMGPTGGKSWSYSERLIILISRVPDEKGEFCSRLRNVFISFSVWMFTRFRRTKSVTVQRKELGPCLGRACFCLNECFLYCDIFRTPRVQNNMFTFRRREQKTRKSKPGTFLIHSWAMRKFLFDFIDCKLSLSAPRGWLYIQKIMWYANSSIWKWK